MFFRGRKPKPVKTLYVRKSTIILILKDSSELEGSTYVDYISENFNGDAKAIIGEPFARLAIEESGKNGFFRLAGGTYLNSDQVHSVLIRTEEHLVKA